MPANRCSVELEKQLMIRSASVRVCDLEVEVLIQENEW